MIPEQIPENEVNILEAIYHQKNAGFNCIGSIIIKQNYTEIQIIDSEFHRIIKAHNIAIGTLQAEKDRLFKRVCHLKRARQTKVLLFQNR